MHFVLMTLRFFLVTLYLCACIRNKREPRMHDHKLLGRSDIVKNITVYGAIIMSGAIESNIVIEKTWRDSHELNASSVAAIRAAHARAMYNQLPFPVVEWPGVFTRPCPQTPISSKAAITERGLAFAHYQIWRDFIFFDHDVLENSKKLGNKEVYQSSTWTSIGGSFTAFRNGSLHKNGVPFKDDDIMVIFEDDADIAIVNASETIIEELSMMTTDILYLGWCEGRLARPVPLCAHAYAMTRRGARQAVKFFEPCGAALDLQLVIMAKNHWLSYRKAYDWSYKNRFNKHYPQPHDGTHGIFHQKRIGSFNGH